MQGSLLRWVPLAAIVVACRAEPIPIETEYQGIVEHDQRTLSFEVPGKVQSVHVERGARLEQYTVLARLDDTLERFNKEILEATGRATRAELDLLYEGSRPEQIAQARTRLAAARAAHSYQREEYQRAKLLGEKQLVPQSELDRARAALDRAESDQALAEQVLSELRRGPRSQEIAAGEARLDAARVQVEASEERIHRHVLFADGPGEVLDVPVKRGEFVAAGAPVVTVADTSRPYVDVFVPQGRISEFEVGAVVALRVDTYADPFAGRVEFISPSTEFTPRFLFSPRERPTLVVRVRVRVHDPERRLRAGIPAFAEPSPSLAPGLVPPPLASMVPPAASIGAPLSPPGAAPSGSVGPAGSAPAP